MPEFNRMYCRQQLIKYLCALKGACATIRSNTYSKSKLKTFSPQVTSFVVCSFCLLVFLHMGSLTSLHLYKLQTIWILIKVHIVCFHKKTSLKFTWIYQALS